MTYRALNYFREMFENGPYLHRSSMHGDRISQLMFEDLYELDPKSTFARYSDAKRKGLSVKNSRVGVCERRCDGLFGDLVPGTCYGHPKFSVGRGEVATVDIGVETKILFKSMKKQINDRIQGLRQAALSLSAGSNDRPFGQPILIAIVGVNHAPYTIGFEGEREYKTTGKAGQPHPVSEANEVIAKIHNQVRPIFFETILLRYSSTNDDALRFKWEDKSRTEKEYGASLLRILHQFEARFAHRGAVPAI